jgi:GT2 family glycosyltransferase
VEEQPQATLSRVFGASAEHPALSIVIVAYATDELEATIGALACQRFDQFETIVVDNGRESLAMLAHYQLRYFKLACNYGLSAGRNFATAQALAPLIAFLDDDAVPAADWTAVIMKVLDDPAVVGVRGRGRPKRGKIFNHLAYHYDLGEAQVPAVLDFEANIAVRTEALRAVGGFDPRRFGGEGSELSKRLRARGEILYVPGLVVSHDYADSLGHYLRKQYRHAVVRHTDVLAGAYEPPPQLPGRAPTLSSRLTRLDRMRLAVIRRLGEVADLTGIMVVRARARFPRLARALQRYAR